MKLADYLELKTVFPQLNSNTKDDVIAEIAENLSSASSGINYEKLLEVLIEREQLCSTAVDNGVAVPHAKLDGINDIVVGFGRSLQGVDFDSLDRKPSHFFITLIAPQDLASKHIQLIARISKIFKDQELRSKLMRCETDEEIFELIVQEDEKY